MRWQNLEVEEHRRSILGQRGIGQHMSFRLATEKALLNQVGPLS